MAKAQATPKAEPKTEKLTRINWATAANQVVAAMGDKTTLTELAALADALVVDHGGNSRIRSATYHVRHALETAEALGAVRLVRPTDLHVERV